MSKYLREILALYEKYDRAHPAPAWHIPAGIGIILLLMAGILGIFHLILTFGK